MPPKPQAQTRRINRGRGHSYIVDGNPTTGVTTAIGEGFPKPGLIGWAANATRDYAVDHWDELAALPLSERIKRLSKARYEDRDEAGNRGTEVHRLAMRHALGETIEPPDYLEGHVRSYEKFHADWSPVERLVEVVVINRRYRYAGTLDLVTELGDGLTWLLDLKTARSGVYAENGLQLAAYRNAETYLDADGREAPMPAVDRCGVVWLRADGYDLVPVEAGPNEYRTFLYALAIARWRDDADGTIVGEALKPK